MSSADSTTTVQTAPVNPRSRVILARPLGRSIEFYDFLVFASAAMLAPCVLFSLMTMFTLTFGTTAKTATTAAAAASRAGKPFDPSTFRPMGAESPELFATNVRYAGSGIRDNLASILGAALAPHIAVTFWTSAHGGVVLVGICLSIAAVITLVTLRLSKESRDSDVTTIVELAGSRRARPTRARSRWVGSGWRGPATV